jgi:uncharacterized protein
MKGAIAHKWSGRARAGLAASASCMAVALLLFGTAATAHADDGEDDLRPGPILALAPAPYDGYVRFAQYVVARDGTRIALDYYRPTHAGALHTEKLPVVFTQDRYLRAMVTHGHVYTRMYHFPPLYTLLTHGYVIATADVRGSGASFGLTDGWFGPKEAQDAYDVIQWLAAQPWSSGKVGMTGRSYRGIVQYFAAAQAPPALKAIVPEMALFEDYDSIYPGGIFGDWWVFSWSQFVRAQDISAPLEPGWRAAIASGRTGAIALARVQACLEMLTCPSEPRGPPAPVDEDTQGQLLARATEEHKAAPTTFAIASESPFRDSIVGDDPAPTHQLRSPGLLLAKLAASHVAAYHIGGWYDGWTRDTLLWYRNYPNASKLLIGPWYHPATGHVDYAAEYLRWFDYWLKGIDNGVMKEPPITYFTLGAPRGSQWRTARVWPLPGTKLTRYYFEAGRSSSVTSVNDGGLAAHTPGSAVARDDYTIDYTTTLGIDNRWTLTGAGGSGGPPYAGLRENDAKGLTYTTAPLAADMEVTGHPVVHLWMSSSAPDVDVFACLEEVQPDGTSRFVTDGKLRASHRALATAPYDNLGLPYHRSFKSDLRPMNPGEVTELVFDLQPTSILFHAGDRIRLTIMGADKDTFDTPIQTPAPTISVVRGGSDASYVVLPIIPHAAARDGAR